MAKILVLADDRNPSCPPAPLFLADCVSVCYQQPKTVFLSTGMNTTCGTSLRASCSPVFIPAFLAAQLCPHTLSKPQVSRNFVGRLRENNNATTQLQIENVLSRKAWRSWPLCICAGRGRGYEGTFVFPFPHPRFPSQTMAMHRWRRNKPCRWGCINRSVSVNFLFANTVCQASGSRGHLHGPYTVKYYHKFPEVSHFPVLFFTTGDACLLDSSHLCQNICLNTKKTLALSPPSPQVSLLVLTSASQKTYGCIQLLNNSNGAVGWTKRCKHFHNYWNCTHVYATAWLFISSTSQQNGLSLGQNAISLP